MTPIPSAGRGSHRQRSRKRVSSGLCMRRASCRKSYDYNMDADGREAYVGSDNPKAVFTNGAPAGLTPCRRGLCSEAPSITRGKSVSRRSPRSSARPSCRGVDICVIPLPKGRPPLRANRKWQICMNAKTLALICQQMRPILADVEPETLEAVGELIDPIATAFKREHGLALAVAYFNELRAKSAVAQGD